MVIIVLLCDNGYVDRRAGGAPAATTETLRELVSALASLRPAADDGDRIDRIRLPEAFALLRAGRITEWRATLVARETVFLSREHRAAVDAELAPLLGSWGDRQVDAEARRAAYRLDPHGFLARVRGAEKDRRVTLRPAPDAMARLTALLPVAQGVAAYTALCRAADSTTAGGDARGRGQIMADTLVERVTGQASADAVRSRSSWS